MFFLINISYLFLTIFQSGFSIYKLIAAFFDLTTYALYFSEFANGYIDNQKLNYNNFIDFFNNNIGFFLCTSLVYVIINNCLISVINSFNRSLLIFSFYITFFAIHIVIANITHFAVNYYNFFILLKRY